jgi:plastocyanin
MKKLTGSKSRFLISSIILFVILGVSNSCTKSTDYMNVSGNTTGTGVKGGPGANEVWIQGMAYNPSTITVTAGTTITWTNKDAVGHTVTSSPALFDSGLIGTNLTWSRLFDTAGTFTYYCTVHPSMTATVIVK